MRIDLEKEVVELLNKAKAMEDLQLQLQCIDHLAKIRESVWVPRAPWLDPAVGAKEARSGSPYSIGDNPAV